MSSERSAAAIGQYFVNGGIQQLTYQVLAVFLGSGILAHSCQQFRDSARQGNDAVPETVARIIALTPASSERKAYPIW